VRRDPETAANLLQHTMQSALRKRAFPNGCRPLPVGANGTGNCNCCQRDAEFEALTLHRPQLHAHQPLDNQG
jgi:hypothetical protein